jgi:hypothetical protein
MMRSRQSRQRSNATKDGSPLPRCTVYGVSEDHACSGLRGDYRATWRIRAQTTSTMRSDLVALGVQLGWVGLDDKEEAAVDIVMKRLRDEGEGILLIFDNAVDANTLNDHLPQVGVARVLVTSNAPDWRGLTEPVEIEVWPNKIGADYLIARTGAHGRPRCRGDLVSAARWSAAGT